MKKAITFLLALCCCLCLSGAAIEPKNQAPQSQPPATNETAPQKKFIKWIDFNASKEMIEKSCKAASTIKSPSYGVCEILAYLALKNGNNFNIKRDSATLKKFLKSPDELYNLYANNKYFKYYAESYHAVLDGIVTPHGEIIGYHPIAKGFWYRSSDDFGNARGYGFKRKHLGHDMFGSTGAPIIAVEGGTITELGWNRYGGWRIGIRSDDTKRYYYYAHLRKDKPFAEGLAIGDKVTAGDVIGYLGTTGYSRKENTNMKTTKPHLHFGMQIIFDKSQEDGNGEIWIDCYQLCRFLQKNRAKVEKDTQTKQYHTVRAAALPCTLKNQFENLEI